MRITVISDVHCGHESAVFPADFEIPETDATINLNSVQKVLLEYWDQFWDIPEVKDSKYCLNLAESIEGNNRKEFGRSNLLPTLSAQANAFIQLIKPKIKGKKYLSVDGSGYHGSLDTSVEHAICKALGGKHWGIIGNWIPIGTDKLINFAHCMGNPMIYKSTMLDRESLFMDAIEKKVFGRHVDLMVRGHGHQYFLVHNGSRLVYMNPCWKVWNPVGIFGAKAYPIQYPTIGGTIIEILKNGRINVIKKSFPVVHLHDKIQEF